MQRRDLSAAASALALGLVLGAAATGAAMAQTDYPSKPIRWVVTFQPGSSPDITSRFLAQKLGEQLKQTVIVDNRAGAGGLIGADAVAKAPPDGYTLGYLSTQHFAHKYLLKTLPYDVMKDFQPIQLTGTLPQVVVVAASNPATSMADFAARAKAAANPVTFGSGGISSPAHLAGQALASAAGFKALHVPYKGSPDSLNAVMGGQVDYAVTTLTTALPLLRAGSLRALGITSAHRSDLLPAVPTLMEAGVNNFVFESWGLLVVPVQTPKPIVDKLVAAMDTVMADPATLKFTASQGARADRLPLAQLPAFLQKEQAKAGAWIKDAGIVME